MNQDFKMEEEVMKRVRMIYVFRRLSQPAVIKVTALVFFGLVVAFKVSFLNILYNMPRWSDPDGLYQFYLSAFRQTEMVIKLMSVGLAAASSWLIKDLMESAGGIRNLTFSISSFLRFGQIRRFFPLINR